MSIVPDVALPILVFIVGALVGSFLNVCIGRIPAGESVVTPPSHCPKCKTPIRFYDNVPLLSFLILGARCRSCREPISPRYFVVELMMGLFALALFHWFGVGFSFVVGFVFIAALIVISFIDIDHRIIPDVISLPGIVLGFLFTMVSVFEDNGRSEIIPSPLSSFIGILSGGGFLWLTAVLYEIVRKREGMGGGDIKLLAMIGAFLGWPSVIMSLFIGCLVGSIVGLIGMWRTKSGLELAIPFGPFLCLGALCYLFYGPQIVEWYLPPR